MSIMKTSDGHSLRFHISGSQLNDWQNFKEHKFGMTEAKLVDKIKSTDAFRKGDIGNRTYVNNSMDVGTSAHKAIESMFAGALEPTVFLPEGSNLALIGMPETYKHLKEVLATYCIDDRDVITEGKRQRQLIFRDCFVNLYGTIDLLSRNHAGKCVVDWKTTSQVPQHNSYKDSYQGLVYRFLTGANQSYFIQLEVTGNDDTMDEIEGDAEAPMIGQAYDIEDYPDLKELVKGREVRFVSMIGDASSVGVSDSIANVVQNASLDYNQGMELGLVIREFLRFCQQRGLAREHFTTCPQRYEGNIRGKNSVSIGLEVFD